MLGQYEITQWNTTTNNNHNIGNRRIKIII